LWKIFIVSKSPKVLYKCSTQNRFQVLQCITIASIYILLIGTQCTQLFFSQFHFHFFIYKVCDLKFVEMRFDTRLLASHECNYKYLNIFHVSNYQLLISDIIEHSEKCCFNTWRSIIAYTMRRVINYVLIASLRV